MGAVMEDVPNAVTEEMKKHRLTELKKLAKLMDSIVTKSDSASFVDDMNQVQKLLTLIFCKYQCRSSSPMCFRNDRHAEQFCLNLLNQLMKDPSCSERTDGRFSLANTTWAMIKQWSEILLNDFELTFLYDISEVDEISDEYLAEFKVVLRMLSSNFVAKQKIAARFLCKQTGSILDYKILFGKIPNTIPYLLYSLLDGLTRPDPSLQRDMVKALFYISNIKGVDMLPYNSESVVGLAVPNLDGALDAADALTKLAQSIDQGYWWEMSIENTNRELLFTKFLEMKVDVLRTACLELVDLYPFYTRGRDAIRGGSKRVIRRILMREIEPIDSKSDQASEVDFQVAKKNLVDFILNIFLLPDSHIIWLHCIAMLNEAWEIVPSLVNNINAEDEILNVLNDVLNDVSFNDNLEFRELAVSLLEKLN